MQEGQLVDARGFKVGDVRKTYDRLSGIYAKTMARLEHRSHLLALEEAAIQPHEKVLEVAVGPGRALLEIVKRVDEDNIVQGVDISPKMRRLAERLVQGAGYSNIELSQADARELHFQDNTFDVLYNAYMLDLVPFADMPAILSEFKRVLKPGGRLVLLNMSKPKADRTTLWERLYRSLPDKLVLLLLGGCRPVFMETRVEGAGFREVERRFVQGGFPSEIVIAKK